MTSLLQLFAAPCQGGGSFFGFPKWYKYLEGQTSPEGVCSPVISSINDTWLILAAAIEILLRAGAIIAIFVVIYGGFLYLTSQGEPDKTSKARGTILNALIGLTISVLSAAAITFIAGSIS